MQSQVSFNRVPKKVPEKVPGGFGAEPGQVQQGSGESSGGGLGGFGAEPGQVQQRSGEGPGEGLGGFGAEPGQVQQGFRRSFRRRSGRLWCRTRSGSTGFRREGSGEGSGRLWSGPGRVQQGSGEVWEALQGQVRQGSGEGSGEGLEGFGAEPGQVQQGSGKVPEKVWEALVLSRVRFNRVPEKVPEKAWESVVQSQVRFNRICGHLTHGNPAEVFPALGLAARFRKICVSLLTA